MLFTYSRTIRFQDTDAAGVVYFANALAMCHEAYEESLAASGINLKLFFGSQKVAIPIVHASVDFFHPMFCGDRINIYLTCKQLTREKFEIAYQIVMIDSQHLAAKAISRHVCIDPILRNRKKIPAEIMQWLQQWGETES